MFDNVMSFERQFWIIAKRMGTMIIRFKAKIRKICSTKETYPVPIIARLSLFADMHSASKGKHSTHCSIEHNIELSSAAASTRPCMEYWTA
jgi:hypothetical protein